MDDKQNVTIKRVSIVLSLILVILVLVLLNNHRTKRQNVLGAATIVPLKKDNFIFPVNTNFKYYSILKPSTNIEDKLIGEESSITYTINDDGLNDRFNYNTFKTAEIFRIVTLGDSFTFGQYVNTTDNWTELLEDLLNNNKICPSTNKFEVINLGMPGFDIPYLVKRYNDLGLKYHPDLIIWFESGSGLTRNNEVMHPYIQECEKNTDLISEAKRKNFHECWKKAEEDMINRNTLEKVKRDSHDWLTKFLSLKNITPTLFITLHFIDERDKNSMRSLIQQTPNTFFSDAVSDIYSNGKFFPDGHPNQKGHKSIANDIYSILINNKTILSCN